MANDKPVYEPGELSRVRNKLGSIDDSEAKRMAKLLGGEVGAEKSTVPKTPVVRSRPNRPRQENVEVIVGGPRGTTGLPRSQSRPAAGSTSDEDSGSRGSALGSSTLGSSTLQPKLSYWERVRMDRYASHSEFEIKNTSQVITSIFSFFGAPPDLVNPAFVTKRISEYYKRLETLVITTRTLLPRDNTSRMNILRKKAPFVFLVMETIRTWNLDKISTDISRLQSRPRNVLVSNFSEILKAAYRPLFILEQLDTDIHIKGAFKVVYKMLYLEDPVEAKKYHQEQIRIALSSFAAVRRDMHYLLYPLLMKLLSSRWYSYENFFREQHVRFLAFIDASDMDRIVPAETDITDDSIDLRNTGDDDKEEQPGDDVDENKEEDENDPAVIARKAEQKAVDRGMETLETLFPQAGWNRIDEFPDLYPYFGKMFDLSRGYEQISPSDPLHQTVVLLRILEELFFGLRYVSFGADAPGLEDNAESVVEIMTELINNWHVHLEHSYYKEYLPRVREYARILEGSVEARTSSYAKRLLNELHWIKRLYFFPYYKFESLYPAPFQKKDLISFYPEIRKLRIYLTAVAAGIEQGIKAGGAQKKAACPGINNPWENYKFEVPNPLSQRLDALLEGKPKNNATLIFFTLAVSAVLDYVVNNENSWAYGGERAAPLFRGIGGSKSDDTEDHVDADALFHQSISKKTDEADLPHKSADKEGDKEADKKVDFEPEPLPEDETSAQIVLEDTLLEEIDLDAEAFTRAEKDQTDKN
ncbi:hypothetical protein AGMMS49928_16580 [Spirochaetia bacterium]|nr:hypothetical protein AGMMS49928_16580 [Spirochaetia bacterium]